MAANPPDERWTNRHAALMLTGQIVALIAGRVDVLAIAGAISLVNLIVLSRASFGGLRGFGAANSVTALRLLLTIALAFAAEAGEGMACALLALLNFALDGVDGWLARREQRRPSAAVFGARLDMESDAVFVMVLSLALFDLDRAGPWVLLAGSLRYVYVLWLTLLPGLTREVPRSRFGRHVFSIVVSGFCASFWPLEAISQPLCAAVTCCLLYSFGQSFLWSLMHHSQVHDAAE